jgi:uncharacterized protein YegJ (DUF2314 family)
MKTVLIITVLATAAAFAQSNDYAKTPKDKPAPYSEALERALQPYIAQGRRTYPAAKKRFLAGLPPKYIFSVSRKIYDHPRNRVELVFVGVDSIKDGRVSGWLATHTTSVTKYHYGDQMSFPESEILDWAIIRPDGTEEGNIVGKFIDTWKPPK